MTNQTDTTMRALRDPHKRFTIRGLNFIVYRRPPAAWAPAAFDLCRVDYGWEIPLDEFTSFRDAYEYADEITDG